jgi:transcriptional regulator with XRE-family HTH domain
MNELLKRLAHAREQAGLSQSQAARLSGAEVVYIKGVESGDFPLSEQVFHDLCKLYDVSPEWVKTGENPNFDRQAWLDQMRAKGMDFDDANRTADLLESLRQEGE